MFTAHTMKLPDGVEIFYTDNGPVDGSQDYTTLIMLHGAAITGHNFEKLHKFSHSFNLRTVFLNRRDYYGSTKYTDEELDDLNNGRRVFLDRLSVQLAEFIRKFVEMEGIPKINVDGRTGGIALGGWSGGVANALTLFSDPELFNENLYQAIEPYVKDLILYDCPYFELGLDFPEDQEVYSPWLDPDFKTSEEVFRNFGPWVSSYYDHGCTGPPSFDYRKRTERFTIASWTQEEYEKNVDSNAAARCEIPMVYSMQSELKSLARRVLFDCHLCQSFFPGVKVTFITTTRTVWHCIWGGMEGKRVYESYVSRGEKGRDACFFNVEGNHFLHYDDPQALLETIVKGIRNTRT